MSTWADSSTPALVAEWRARREQGKACFDSTDAIARILLEREPDTRGWNNGGRPVEVRRRFEVVLFDAAAVADWAEGLALTGALFQPTLTSYGREVIRRAYLEDGEVVQGVSAGMGAPFLAMGKVQPGGVIS